MSPRELIAAVNAVLSGDSKGHGAEGVARMALQMAEMVGWAPGVIDPRGQLHRVLDRIRLSAREQFAATGQAGMAALHDALADLMNAVARHDRELRGDCDGEGGPPGSPAMQPVAPA